MSVAKYLIIIFFAPTILLFNFFFLLFDQSFYKSEFIKLSVYQEFGSTESVDEQLSKLLNYFCCGGSLDEDFYSQREILHLKDVKSLIKLSAIQLILTITLVATCLVILANSKKIELAIFALKWGSIATILSIIILWLSSFISLPKFEKSFETFHQVAFDNDLWLLPPQSNLIRLFPQEFFVDFSNRLALQTVALAFIILIGSIVLQKNVAKKR